jgi:hypothetical protein
MPVSDLEGKDWISERFVLLATLKKISTVLDLGVGCGTYSDLLRPFNKNSHWIGVEVWGPYIENYHLNKKYDEIIISDIRYLNYSKIKKPDCIFAGDVLEHIPENDACALIHELVTLAKVIFISVPIVKMPQGAWEGNPYEAHIEDSYTHERMMSILPCVYDYSKGYIIGTYLLSRDVNICKTLDNWGWNSKNYRLK